MRLPAFFRNLSLIIFSCLALLLSANLLDKFDSKSKFNLSKDVAKEIENSGEAENLEDQIFPKFLVGFERSFITTSFDFVTSFHFNFSIKEFFYFFENSRAPPLK